VPDFNPHLRAHLDAAAAQGDAPLAGGSVRGGANKGDASSIETYAAPQLIRWQTRPAPPSEYENALGDALEALFSREIYDLDAIVAGLNESGPAAPDGEPWTEASFQAAMKRLGDGHTVEDGVAGGAS